MSTKLSQLNSTFLKKHLNSASRNDAVALSNNANHQEPHTDKTPGFAVSLRIRLGWLLLKHRKLRADIHHFGSWLEHEAATIAGRTNESIVSVELKNNATVQTVRIGPRKHSQSIGDFEELWRFLLSINVSALELDVRLEWNQIADVFTLLYILRRKLRKAGHTTAPGDPVAELSREQGILIACTRASIRDGKLTVSYSYCATRLSRMVHFFESRNSTFGDHRALFQAAPRVALLVALVAAVPVVIFAAANQMWILAAIAAVEGFALLGIMYLLFMIIGSVEYDNEEKNYRLGNAYGQLKSYAERITADTRRARVVQERILPDLTGMALSNQIEWAACFMPQTEVGGDYFDVQALDDRRVAIIFSDVSGHGMAAAFITAILKTTFQNCVDNNSSLNDLIEKLNSNLFRLTPDNSFAAVFAAIYDASLKKLYYINAGHNPEPWHLPVAGQEYIDSLRDARSMILGIRPGIEIIVSSRTLNVGDTVLMVSDGIIDNQNVDGEEYGLERFVALMRENRGSGVERLVETIAEQARLFCPESEQQDDRTVLAFQISR